MRVCSSTVRNSLPRGSANSCTTTCRPRLSEWPASSDDLIKSSADGNCCIKGRQAPSAAKANKAERARPKAMAGSSAKVMSCHTA